LKHSGIIEEEPWKNNSDAVIAFIPTALVIGATIGYYL
jgi:hypothetical protein